jgi:hypothetical protein
MEDVESLFNGNLTSWFDAYEIHLSNGDVKHYPERASE